MQVLLFAGLLLGSAGCSPEVSACVDSGRFSKCMEERNAQSGSISSSDTENSLPDSLGGVATNTESVVNGPVANINSDPRAGYDATGLCYWFVNNDTKAKEQCYDMVEGGFDPIGALWAISQIESSGCANVNHPLRGVEGCFSAFSVRDEPPLLIGLLHSKWSRSGNNKGTGPTPLKAMKFWLGECGDTCSDGYITVGEYGEKVDPYYNEYLRNPREYAPLFVEMVTGVPHYGLSFYDPFEDVVPATAAVVAAAPPQVAQVPAQPVPQEAPPRTTCNLPLIQVKENDTCLVKGSTTEVYSSAGVLYYTVTSGTPRIVTPIQPIKVSIGLESYFFQVGELFTHSGPNEISIVPAY